MQAKPAEESVARSVATQTEVITAVVRWASPASVWAKVAAETEAWAETMAEGTVRRTEEVEAAARTPRGVAGADEVQGTEAVSGPGGTATATRARVKMAAAATQGAATAAAAREAAAAKRASDARHRYHPDSQPST